MKILLIFQFYLLRSTIALSVSSQLPSFTWVEGIDPVLKIRFPDGGHDAIRFHKTERLEGEDDDCIMSGKFEQEPDVSVTLTGGCVNSKDFEMTIVGSERLQHATFKISNGKTETTDHPTTRSSVVYDDVVRSPGLSFRDQPAPTSQSFSLPHHIWLPLELYADDDFRKTFGSDEKVQRAMHKIVGHAQAWFSHKNLLPEVVLQPSVEGSWNYSAKIYTASDSELWKASDYVDKLRNVDTPYGHPRVSFQNKVSVFFGIQSFFQLNTGIAYLGSICSKNHGNKVTVIVEHWRHISKSGEVLAHELAHTLGIDHDFHHETHSYLLDKSSKSCYTKGSLMDYSFRRSTWSKCSIESFHDNISKSRFSCLEAF